MISIIEMLAIVGVMSLMFAILCATADWAIPRLVTLRRRRRIMAARAPELAPMMREEWQ